MDRFFQIWLQSCLTFDPKLCFITILAIYMTISIGSIKIIQLIQLSRALETSQTLFVIGMGAEKRSFVFLVIYHKNTHNKQLWIWLYSYQSSFDWLNDRRRRIDKNYNKKSFIVSTKHCPIFDNFPLIFRDIIYLFQ